MASVSLICFVFASVAPGLVTSLAASGNSDVDPAWRRLRVICSTSSADIVGDALLPFLLLDVTSRIVSGTGKRVPRRQYKLERSHKKQSSFRNGLIVERISVLRSRKKPILA